MNVACERYWLVPTLQQLKKFANRSLIEGLYISKILNAQLNTILKLK